MPVRLASQVEPIPGYKLIERLGRGGFGEVWKAEAPGGLLKAIKFVYGDLNESKDKGGGNQELRALNRVKTVRHPFILSLERVDIVEGQLVIVMELADRNLLHRFRDCQAQQLPGIPRDELLRYLGEAAEALDLMNVQYNLQHLDIKPQNLFLVHNHVKIADFGLVKDLQGMTASVTGGVTPVYAAPETFEGKVSRFCDEYSLAIVFQELLTGHRPFTGTSASQLLKQHLEEPPDLSPLPPADQAVLRRALAKKPDDRYPSCSHLIQLLRGETPTDLSPIRAAAGLSAEPVAVSDVPPGSDSADSLVSLGEEKAGNFDTKDLAKVKVEAALQELTHRPGPTDTIPPIAPQVPDAIAGPTRLEATGPGVLFPALVIGLGETGTLAVQKLREALFERFGSGDAVPHIRLLCIDVDPDTIANAAKGATKGASLSARELALVRLNRPVHFLKPREGHLPVTDWLDSELLYRIPRNHVTNGLRCLGRLALVDNYRDIADRLRSELAACAESGALATARLRTELELRSNRPRVYIVTHLAGGAGSGMFLDVAYLVRSDLKQLGHAQPELVGVFVVPASAEASANWPLAQSNTFAALTELHHYSLAETTFNARYVSREPPLCDPDPPFARCIILAEENDVSPDRSVAGLAAGYLYRDLVTPLGRAADARRAAMLSLSSKQPRQPGLVVQTFGMNRFAWPRRALVHQIAHRLCLSISQHWVSKEPGPIQEAVAAWAREEWTKRQMQADRLIAQLKAATDGAVSGQTPEALFEAPVQRLVQPPPPAGIPDPAQVRAALDDLEKLVGRPETDRPPPRVPDLVEVLDQAAETLLATCEQNLAEMAVHLVEQPRFRLVGAEEAIRQFNALIQQTLQQQEPLANEFMTKANQAYARIHGLIDTIKSGAAAKRKGPPLIVELAELLRNYPTFRLRGLIMQRVLTILRSLFGNCPEYLREFTHCRVRLLDMVKSFDLPLDTRSALDLGPGRNLFPPGCQNLEEAVNRFISQVSGDELIELDGRIQNVLRQQFTALVHVCTTPMNQILKDVEAAMEREMQAHVTERLSTANAIETFLALYEPANTAASEVAEAHQKAAPRLQVEAAASPTELTLVLVPDESSAEQFRRHVQQALPMAELAMGSKGDDIVFYRELPALTFLDLPHTGFAGRQAYQQRVAAEHFTPHVRTDLTDWQLPEQR
jgi:serine/threonine protein kinase